VIGVVAVNMLLADGGTIDARAVRARMEHAPIVLDTAGALQVVGRLRASTTHLALVFDEFGNFEGVITALDVLEAITGSFQDAADEEPAIVTRADGSLLVAGWMPADELAEHLGLTLEEDRNYATAAGFVLSRFGRLPGVGEHVDVDAWRFEIVDLDGKRIDKLLAARLSSAPGSA
jgi:putative hemolysin